MIVVEITENIIEIIFYYTIGEVTVICKEYPLCDINDQFILVSLPRHFKVSFIKIKLNQSICCSVTEHFKSKRGCWLR